MDDTKATAEPEDEEKKARKVRAQLRGILIFLFIYAVPVLIAAYLVGKMHFSLKAERAWAEAELKKEKPDPHAYGSLGTALLNEHKVAQAIPLLKKASQLEAPEGRAGALVYLIEAHVEGLEKGLKEGSRPEALKLLQELKARAAKLPQGRAAAAYHAAGKLYGHLGERQAAYESLKKASEMQPDDWVDEGGGFRHKQRGLASQYMKDLAAAQMQ